MVDVIAATRVEVYDVTCPALTAPSAAIELALFDPGDFDVVAVQIVIPDGHAGTTGLALAIAHQAILPRNRGAWISGNDDQPRFALKGYPRGAPWTAFACNNDTIPHTWELRFEFDDSPLHAVTLPIGTPISPAAVYAVGTGATGAP